LEGFARLTAFAEALSACATFADATSSEIHDNIDLSLAGASILSLLFM
jgi:hypothetical protein